jgi:DNA-binding response OmpR family regulator
VGGKQRVAVKILVVDDDANIRSALKHRLGREGYRVLLSATGEDALEKTRTEQPDLIVLDLVLPGLDGFRFLEQLKSEAAISSVPVLVLTAYGLEENRRRSLDLGASGFLTKPFSARQLVAHVTEIVGR